MTDSMNDMPVRELITAVRGQVKDLGSEQLIVTLVLNVLMTRLEREANLADAALKFIQLSPGDPDCSRKQFEAYKDLRELLKTERPDGRQLP